MQKMTALTLGAIILLSFLFFVSPVGQYVSGIAQLLRPAPPAPPAGEELPFSLPAGFAAYVYADNVPNARVMVRDPKNALLVSEPDQGKVIALPNLDADGKADHVVTVLEGLRKPHGLLVLCSETGFESADQDDCTLYVAEEHRVAAYQYDADTYSAIFEKVLVELPDDSGHFTRTLMLHPDNKRILVSVGSSCNVCVEKDERRAAILAIDPDKSGFEVFATGLRNTVFMTTHYITGDIWGTDMGRDLLGDDLPPDELNIIREGKHFGWPICYGKNVHDTAYDKNTYIRNPCMEPFETPSHIDIPAHSAPLGIAFVPEEGWPEAWWYDALVAYHGSWNRSVPTGYKIVRIPLDAQGNPEGEPQDFMTGFIDANGRVVGRPVDILVEPGGVMYVSDDRAGAIYRVARTSSN